MLSAGEILRRNRIECTDARAEHGSPGHYYAKCPKCSADRRFNKNAKCLSIHIDGKGVRWFCNNGGSADCNGGEYFDSDEPRQPIATGHRRGPPARRESGYAALHRQSKLSWR